MGKLLLVLATAAGLGLVAALLVPADRTSAATGWWSVAETVAIILALTATVSLLGVMLHRGERHLAPSGAEALRNDPRPPVLYLRPFEAEAALTAEERVLARIMEREVGPFVAVGKPEDKLPPLGAARFYTSDLAEDRQDWQLLVRGMLLRARLVLIVPGRTTGLAWEIAQCRELLQPRQLVVALSGAAAEYDAFRGIAAQAGLKLPAIAPGELASSTQSDLAGFVTFDDDWTARLVVLARRSPFETTSRDESEQRLRQALAPTLARVAMAKPRHN